MNMKGPHGPYYSFSVQIQIGAAAAVSLSSRVVGSVAHTIVAAVATVFSYCSEDVPVCTSRRASGCM